MNDIHERHELLIQHGIKLLVDSFILPFHLLLDTVELPPQYLQLRVHSWPLRVIYL